MVRVRDTQTENAAAGVLRLAITMASHFKFRQGNGRETELRSLLVNEVDASNIRERGVR
jgi:hypothetical protein